MKKTSTKNKKTPMAKRYQMAHSFALQTLPDWKREAILHDINLDKETRYVIEFCKEVIQLAESMTFNEKGVPPINDPQIEKKENVYQFPQDSVPRF